MTDDNEPLIYGGETYLGDGLYASFDGWQFGLRAPRENGDHVVFLEPPVLAKFQEFVAEQTAAAIAAAKAAK